MASWDDLTLEEQEAIKTHAIRSGYVSWLSTLLPYILIPPVFCVTAVLGPRAFGIVPQGWWQQVVIVGATVSSIIAARLVERRRHHRAFRRAMRDLGHPVCVGCGYRLDGHDESAACPECGASGLEATS